MTKGSAALFVMVLVIASTVVSTTTEQPPAKIDKAKPAAAPATARITPAIIALITEKIKTTYATEFLGVTVFVDDSLPMSINTNRGFLGYRMAKAEEEGGRYRVKPADLPDILTVDCGDSDRADLWECVSVRLRNKAGAVIKPLSYSATNKPYQNGFGAQWRCREVFATYPIRGLVDGFDVDYEDASGTEFTRTVTAEEASDTLLLGLKAP